MKSYISKRLLEIADIVDPCNVVADIGCDHALLSIFLVDEKKANYAIAMDINDGPLESARKNIEKYGFGSKIKTRLSNGFEALKANEADCIIIAGMGGLLMKDILKAGKDIWEKASQLVLSPHRDDRVIREYLVDLAFYKEDRFIQDGKDFYTIMSFYPQKTPKKIKEEELLFGLNPTRDFLDKKKKVLEDVSLSLSRGKKSDIIEKKEEIKRSLYLLNKAYENQGFIN